MAEIVNVINPSGKLVGLPKEDVNDAIASGGYKLASQADINAAIEQQKYGEGLGNELKAGLAAAGRGATFGLSDVVLTKSGAVNPETLAKLKQYNPDVSLGAEIGGAILPTLLMPESLAARTPVGLLGRGAGMIEKGVAGLGKAAAEVAGEGTLAARAIETSGHIAAKALAGAGEGAAFGAGEAISEHALGNPEPFSESLLANMGHGAAWGGALGGLIGIGESAIPKAAETAKSVLKESYGKILGKAAEDGSGIEPGLAQKGIAKGLELTKGPEAAEDFLKKAANPEDYKVMTAQEKSEHVAEAVKAFNNTTNTVKKFINDFYDEVKPKAVKESLVDINPAKPKILYTQSISGIDDAIQTIKSKPSRYSEKFADILDEIKNDSVKDSYSKLRLDDSSVTSHFFNDLESMKRKLQRVYEKNKKSLDDKVRETLPLINSLQRNIAKSLEDSEIWGKTAAAQQKFNAAYSDYRDALKIVNKTHMQDFGRGKEAAPTKFKTMFNQINSADGQFKAQFLKDYLDKSSKVIDAAEDWHKIAKVDLDKKALQDILTKNQTNVNIAKNRFGQDPRLGHGFFSDLSTVHLPLVGNLPGKIAEHVIKGLQNPTELLTKLSAMDAASKKVGTTIDKIAKKAYEPIIATAEHAKEAAKKVLSKEEVDKQIDEVKEKMSSLEGTHEKLTKATEATSNIAPNITGALQRSMLKGLIFLHSKIPDWSDNTTAMPFDDKKPVSKSQNYQWARYHSAVEDPMLVMKDAVNGTINTQGIETLNAVYPNLYAQMKQSLMNEIVSKKAKNEDLTIPYQKRIAISTFLGMPLDSSQKPVNVTQNQAIISHNAMQKQAQEQQAMKPTQKGLESIDIAGRSRTNAQENNVRGA